VELHIDVVQEDLVNAGLVCFGKAPGFWCFVGIKDIQGKG